MVTPYKAGGWRRGMFLIVLLLLISLLAACGSGGGGSTAPTAASDTGAPAAAPTAGGAEAPGATAAPAGQAAPAESGAMASKVQIAVVKGAMIDTMRKLAEQYQQANPGITVEVIEEPEGGAFDALIAAGNQPDMFVGSFGSQIGKYAAQEALIPLESMPGAQELFAKIEPETLQQVYGHNFYVPMGADVTVMIYNKELFKEAGLDPDKPPQTWDEFLTAAEKISALPARPNGDKVYGTVFWNDALSWGGWYWNMLQPIYLNGNQKQCQLLNRLGTDIVFDQPDCHLQNFFDFTKQAQQYAPATMEKNFFSRTIGMWPQYGYSWEPNLKEAAGKPMTIGDDVGVAPVPVREAGGTSYSTYGGRALMIMKTTPERQARAWDFAKFLMQDEQNLTFLKELGYLPTLTPLKSASYFAEPARKPFVDALGTAVFPQMFSSADDIANKLLGVYQQAVVEGKITPEQAVSTAATEARSTLKK